MGIEAEVSLYPLRTQELDPVIERFIAHLRAHDVEVEPGSMSTWVSGETGEVFAAISEAFEAVAKDHQAALIIKASNACPQREER